MSALVDPKFMAFLLEVEKAFTEGLVVLVAVIFVLTGYHPTTGIGSWQ